MLFVIIRLLECATKVCMLIYFLFIYLFTGLSHNFTIFYQKNENHFENCLRRFITLHLPLIIYIFICKHGNKYKYILERNVKYFIICNYRTLNILFRRVCTYANLCYRNETNEIMKLLSMSFERNCFRYRLIYSIRRFEQGHLPTFLGQIC
jgi:hypothetical protein